MLKTVAA